MRAMFDIVALWNWNHKLFDKMTLPAEIDKKKFIPNLLIECAELEVRFASPDFMREAIGWWCSRRLPVWEQLAATLHYQYDPINNYDRKEETSDHIDRGRVHNTQTNETEQAGSIQAGEYTHDTTVDMTHGSTAESKLEHTGDGSTTSNTTETTSTTDTDTLTRTAFNSNELEPVEQHERLVDTSRTLEGSGTTTDSSTDTNNASGTDTDTGTTKIKGTNTRNQNNTTTTAGNVTGTEAEDVAQYHKARMYGNIGVTTTQQLIQEQRELVQFDLQKYIIDDFKAEFCLLLY